MIAIIPIVLGAEMKFWQQDACREVIDTVLRTVARTSEIQEVFVGSNDQGILQLAQDHSLKPFFMQEYVDEEHYPLPLGTAELLTLVDTSATFEITDVMVVDFRNPLLSDRILEKAVQDYRKKRQKR